MEANFQDMEERLWNYIDGISDSVEKSAVEKLLESHVEWKAKYHELLEVNELLRSSELDQPSLRFTKNVMEEIARLHIAPATKTYINKKIIWGIGIFFIAIITGFLIYAFGQVNWGASGDTKLPVDFNKIDYSKIDYSKIFNNNYVNAFMLVNIILGLFLLDRYFANKRRKVREDI